MKKITKTKKKEVEVSYHIPSECVRAGRDGRYIIDYTDEDIALYGRSDHECDDMCADDGGCEDRDCACEYEVRTLTVNEEYEETEATPKEWKMAEAVVSSHAWDGAARTARELLESVSCEAELIELYEELDEAEEELDEAVATGELEDNGDGTYTRDRDGAVI